MKNCLIIEDSDLLRQIAGRILKDIGVEAREVATAAQGVEACAARKPDVVLLDWDLPQFGALDFLRALGGFDADQRPAIVLVATENDHQQFTLARAAGAAHHILKPFDADTLKAKLAEIGVVDPGAAPETRAAS
jgi:two-component system chemotaxis response regulator CheY